eukprot:510323_1
MRRVVSWHKALHHYNFKYNALSPLSMVPLINPSTKYTFSTKKHESKPKKSKIKIASDEYDESDTNLEEATVEKETTTKSFRQAASQTISDIKFSDDAQDEPKTFRQKLHKYTAVHLLGLDNILPRMIALRDKNPESIPTVMNAFYIGNATTGLCFFLLCWQCSAYIVHPDLILAYFIMRYSVNYPPGSTFNSKLAQLYKLKYPLLNDCNWSRKMPDPTRQTVDAVADNLTSKIPLLDKLQSFLDNEKWKVGQSMKKFRERTYSNAIKQGFAWDIADNVRVIVGLPLLFAFLHHGGVGLYLSDLEAYNPMIAQWICIYIGGAYGARLSSNWTLRTVVLTTIEKRYGLRAQSGEYYGFIEKDKGVHRKGTMSSSSSDTSESVSQAKMSSKKPKKK